MKVLLAFFATATVAKSETQNNLSEPRYGKVRWVKLHDEKVGPGDFWASNNHNPNEPERQGEDVYNLQMQAIHPNNYGTPAKNVPRGNGDYWRPVGIVDVY